MLGDLGLQKAAGRLQALQREPLRLFVSHHRDVHFRIPQVGTDLDPRDGDIFDAGILQLEQDRGAHLLADGLGNFGNTA